MEDESTLPPPYNLIPSPKCICKMFRWCFPTDGKEYSCNIWVNKNCHTYALFQNSFHRFSLSHVTIIRWSIEASGTGVTLLLFDFSNYQERLLNKNLAYFQRCCYIKDEDPDPEDERYTVRTYKISINQL